MPDNISHIDAPRKSGAAQAIDAKAPARNRKAISPQFRKLIAEDCRVRGTSETAKIWGITFGCALEIQIERLNGVIEAQRERIAMLERRAA